MHHDASDPFGRAYDALVAAVLDGPGETPPDLRRAAAGEGALPEALRPLVERIRDQAYRVTDDDIAALRATYSEDALFEVVVAASLGAARHRLTAGLRALEEATRT